VFSHQTEIVTQAVQQDKSGNIKDAVKLYSQALEYFVPAIYCKFRL